VGAPKRRRGLLGTIGAAILFALAKGKVLLGALKFGSILQTFSTLAVSAMVYAQFYGASLAIGLVLLILIHEYGHGIAAKIMGLKVGAPIFIPFFGAVRLVAFNLLHNGGRPLRGVRFSDNFSRPIST